MFCLLRAWSVRTVASRALTWMSVCWGLLDMETTRHTDWSVLCTRVCPYVHMHFHKKTTKFISVSFFLHSRTFTVQSSASDPSCWQTHTFPRTLENKGSVLCFSSIPVPSLLQCLTPVEATLTPTKMADRPLTSWTPSSTDIYTTFAAWSCVVSPLILKITGSIGREKKKKKKTVQNTVSNSRYIYFHIFVCAFVYL